MDASGVIDELKRRKEAFVTGHSGSSIADLRDVTLAGIFSNAAWIYIVSNNPSYQDSFWLDFLLNWMGLLSSVTVFGENPFLTGVLGISAVLLFGCISKGNKCETIKEPVMDNGNQSATLTVYRSTMLILTSIAILAVDFPIFPRKYAKVETWGISLMDLGVGSFVFSNGIISYKRLKSGTELSKWAKIKQSLRSTVVLVVLGFIRLFSVKAVNYQEHATEYGIHWNFFFTLSLLPLAMIIFDFYSMRLRFVIGLIAAIIYELCLIYHPTFLDYLLNAERIDFISANREGIFSFVGYCIIYLAGQQVGSMFFSISTNPMQLLWKLVAVSIFSSTISYVLLHYHPLQVSRRFASIGYSSMVISFNLLILTFDQLIVECLTSKPRVPRTYQAVNGNGMLVFLVSNVTTGMVNFTFNTLDSPPYKAMAILTVYALFLAVFALKVPFKLKF
ncbi:Gwt1 [Kluyveromyces lactis]|nr:Gwt1 [Kluyveromyces lactis]